MRLSRVCCRAGRECWPSGEFSGNSGNSIVQRGPSADGDGGAAGGIPAPLSRSRAIAALPPSRRAEEDAVFGASVWQFAPRQFEAEDGIGTDVPTRPGAPGPIFASQRNARIGRGRPATERVLEAVAGLRVQMRCGLARMMGWRAGAVSKRQEPSRPPIRQRADRRRQVQRQAPARRIRLEAERGRCNPLVEVRVAVRKQRPAVQIDRQPGSGIGVSAGARQPPRRPPVSASPPSWRGPSSSPGVRARPLPSSR